MTNDEHRRVVREGYDVVADAYAAERDDGPAGAPLLEHFRERVPTGGAILDAGCGDGQRCAARLVPEYDVTGLDISREQVRRAIDAVPVGDFVQGDLTRLPFPTGAFAGLVCYHATIHIPRAEHAALYREFARVVEPGGWLLVSTGAGEWEGSNPNWLDGGVEMRWSFYDAETERELVEDAGFVVERADIVGDEMGDGAFQFLLGQRRA
ncbi:class I SAM-dependent methyltransferase [Haloarchaeobius sp. DYHT-AS-18]|uniref:class I SAM-dependent methyltransferase n=1 Tax=Haloarchaeobius sp. DYHT-AS-18 TaxID=3446117 RepID=UPI003EC03835